MHTIQQYRVNICQIICLKDHQFFNLWWYLCAPQVSMAFARAQLTMAFAHTPECGGDGVGKSRSVVLGSSWRWGPVSPPG